jgi:Regulator of chromosome condensation (RCC1) repeat
MSVYCWGSSSHGELGLGGIDEENVREIINRRAYRKYSSIFLPFTQITTPQAMAWLNAAELEQAACGPTHTLLLTNTGKVYSCGSNDYGQLGQENARKRPRTCSFSMWPNSFIFILFMICFYFFDGIRFFSLRKVLQIHCFKLPFHFVASLFIVVIEFYCN